MPRKPSVTQTKSPRPQDTPRDLADAYREMAADEAGSARLTSGWKPPSETLRIKRGEVGWGNLARP